MARRDDVLLISCLGEQTGGGLFAFNGRDLEQIDSLSSTGLTLGDGFFGRLLWSSGESGSVGELLVYDTVGVQRYLRIDRLREPHDLAWDGTSFLAVSTLTNTVLWLDGSGHVTRAWTAEGDGDAWHLNSLLLTNGMVAAAAFGRFSRHREWSEARGAARGIVFDLETGKDLVTGLECPHDPRRFDGLWLVCNSGRREVLGIEEDTGRIAQRLELDGWTRGVEVTDDRIYVGESANRADPQANGLAHVAVIDRRAWSLVDRIPLPCEEVYDVIRVPADLANGVRRGFRTNPLRTAEQDQLALFDQVGARPARLWATGDPLAPEHCRVALGATLPNELPAGTWHEVPCRIENLAPAFLVSAPPHPVHISYRWVTGSSAEEGERTRLPRSIAPSTSADCYLGLRTPATPGVYELRVTLVQEGVAWFDDLDPSNAWGTTVVVV